MKHTYIQTETPKIYMKTQHQEGRKMTTTQEIISAELKKLN